MDIQEVFSQEQYKRFVSEVLLSGSDSTLPHNLTNSWLVELTKQADMLADSDGGEVFNCAEFMAALKHIHYAKHEFNEVKIDETMLHEYIERYRLELKLEKISRRTNIVVEPSTLETILTDRRIKYVLGTIH